MDRVRKYWGWGVFVVAATLLFVFAPGLASFSAREPEPEELPVPAKVEWESEPPQAAADGWLDGAGLEGDLAAGEVVESDENSADVGLDCLIEPFQELQIRSPVIGLIEEISVDRADTIEEGQLLVRLESDVERAAVDIARARSRMRNKVELQQARNELGERRQSRAERLYASNALSLDLQEEVVTEAKVARLEAVEAKDQLRLAALELDQARATLRRREIRSPISGVVVERLMSVGEVVDEDVILRVAQIDPLRVEVILPAHQFGTVAPGMKATVVPEIPGDEVHVATVSVVDRVIDAASGTFGVRLDLPNPDLAIPGGLPCEIQFVDEPAD